MPDITDLSDEELKKLYETTTPSPGLLEGIPRAVSQGAIGVPNQPKDTAFANEYPIASGGGGMLGRAADIILPMLGGRMAGRALANRIRRPVDEEMTAAFGRKEARDISRRAGITDPSEIEDNVAIGGRAALLDAIRRNKSAARWKSGLQLGGGLMGGAAGGAAGAALHGEDPQSGALIGGATGLGAPVATKVMSMPVGRMGMGLATGAAAWGLDKAGVPIIPQALKDTSLGYFLGYGEKRKR